MSDHQHDAPTGLDGDTLLRRYRRAKDRRGVWENHWRECYAHALPQREGVLGDPSPGDKKGVRLYDATAVDAVDQLSASLLSELTPPWSRWFDFKPGQDVPEEQRGRMAEVLEETANVLQGHFDRANFAVEMHQCYLDLVTAGTAALRLDVGRGYADVPFQSLGPALLDQPPPAFTGDKTVRALGWRTVGPDALWSIRQDVPLPFTLLSVETKVASNG